MSHRIDIAGQRFGRLVVTDRWERRGPRKQTHWCCQCDCGNKTWIRRTSLRSGSTQSCGCLNRELTREMRFRSLAGRRFERLLVTGDFEKRGRYYYWRCLCDCKNETWVRAASLRNGITRSCGCLKIDLIAKRSTKHGHSHHPASGGRGSPTYLAWRSMNARCSNVNDSSARNYVNRGLTVCDRWKDSFANFLKVFSGVMLGKAAEGNNLKNTAINPYM
jgi:hypothetical protein